MRILFRGLRTDGKGWIEGNLLTKYPHHDGNWTIIQDGVVYAEVIPETVGQFVFQKGDMRVFEGDRVLVQGAKKIGLHETVVIKGGFGFTLAENNTSLIDGKCLIAIQKIIGNVHENQ